MELPYAFDLWLDVKTLDELEWEFNHHTNRIALMKQLMKEHGIKKEKRGKNWKLSVSKKG